MMKILYILLFIKLIISNIVKYFLLKKIKYILNKIKVYFK